MKVVCDKASEMVRSGWNAAEACNQLYKVYSRISSITDIINKISKDMRTGGYPALRSLNIENE